MRRRFRGFTPHLGEAVDLEWCEKQTECGWLIRTDVMYERLYPTEGRKPVEELHKLLAETRVRHDRFKVTLGAPPFERDLRDKIVAIQLRFTPAELVPA